VIIQKWLSYLRLNIRQKEIIQKFHAINAFSHFSKLENDKRQLEKLNKLLNHAFKNIPYYEKAFITCGIVENKKIAIKSLSELEKIPFLTKDVIRHEKEKLYSNDIAQRKYYKNSSGGSSGESVEFLQDEEYRISNWANFYVAQLWRGADPYDRTIKIWGAERDIMMEKKSLKDILYDFSLNYLLFNTFKMSEGDMRHYIDKINREKPKLIIAYVQSIYEFAKFAKENNILVEKQNAIHTAAGTLYDFMRKEIEEVFQCHVFNHYGSREVGAIASECSEHDGLHIMMEHTLIEVVNKDGRQCLPGEEGEIVVTTLNNFSMPLIRYKIGDIGIMQEFESCGCGCNYPKLQKVTGRTTDIFRTRSGNYVDGEYFTHLFYFRENIKTFQVIQEKVDQISINIVKKGDITKNVLLDIENKIKLVMGEECKVGFNFVDTIPKTKTGKFLYTISNVK